MVARSWAPPEAEWPETTTGSSPPRDRPNNTAVQPQDSTSRQPIATTSAITVVMVQALACSTASTRSTRTRGRSISVTGRPATSAAMNGTSSAEPRNHTNADQPAVRSAA
nr:hypothetical protein GCM10020241_24050 [Streptoalloteichus tenebrarius]